jgi:hypothetical protein
MFLAVQIALLVVGLYVMSRGRFEIGGREVGNPIASMVGIILAAQLPIALLISIVLGLTEGPTAEPIAVPTRAGEAAPVVTVAGPRSADDNWWVDPLITCGALVLAAGLTGIALRSADEADDVYASLGPADGDRAP